MIKTRENCIALNNERTERTTYPTAEGIIIGMVATPGIATALAPPEYPLGRPTCHHRLYIIIVIIIIRIGYWIDWIGRYIVLVGLVG